jgi:hypothetical protein
MAANKFYSNWQSLVSATEDAQTALVFGFIRHAPVEVVLKPWLEDVLGPDGDLDVLPLAPTDFWPDYPSIVDGSLWTQPELVFRVSDGEPLLVVVENKIHDKDHAFEQICREVIDSANHEHATRIALVMIGPDFSCPYPIKSWQGGLREALRKSGLPAVRARLYYSSWARLGQRISRCAGTAFARYGEDVVEQLKRRGFMGYEGAPMLDDLDMNITNAITAYNRVIVATRQLFRTLTGQPRFTALGLHPWGTVSYKLLTDGTSRALSQPQDYFEVSTFGCCFRKEKWRSRQGVFVAIHVGDDDPELDVGAFACLTRDPMWQFASSDDKSPSTANDEHLGTSSARELPYLAGTTDSTFRYASRPWARSESEGDIPWALDILDSAVAVSDKAPRSRRRVIGR